MASKRLSEMNKDHAVDRLKRVTLILCVTGIISYVFFLLYAASEEENWLSLSQMAVYLVFSLFGAAPYVVLAVISNFSHSKSFSLFLLILVGGVLGVCLYAYVDGILLRKTNGAAIYLLLMLPLVQTVPIVLVLIVRYIVYLRDKYVV